MQGICERNKNQRGRIRAEISGIYDYETRLRRERGRHTATTRYRRLIELDWSTRRPWNPEEPVGFALKEGKSNSYVHCRACLVRTFYDCPS